MAERRDLRPEEMAVIFELATATPDLVAARDRLVAAARGGSAPATGGGRLQWQPSLEPKSWKELMEAVRLGVLDPKAARRFVNVPQPEPSVLRRIAGLRAQRGGVL